MHRIEIEPIGRARSTGQRYRAMWNGEVIVAASKNPELETCRILAARGISGTIETFSPGGTVARMRIDIVRGAELTTSEGEASGPKFKRWQPHPSFQIDEFEIEEAA